MNANLVVAGHWLRVWLLKQIPWMPSYKTRRILGVVGLGWMVFNLWALGVGMGLDAAGTQELTWSHMGSLVVNEAIGFGLVWQMPKKPCKACGDA